MTLRNILTILVATCSLLIATSRPALSSQPDDSPCPYATRINTNDKFRNSLHFICLQRTNGLPQLEVIQYLPRQVVLSRQVNEIGTDQLASFVDDDGILRILTAVPDRINGTSMYSVDPLGPGAIEQEIHTINTQFVNSMTIWKLDLNNEWHLAIANQPYYDHLASPMQNSRSPLPDARPMITVHSWRATYFDSYQVIDLPPDVRVNKLEPMHINGQEFIIVALEAHRYGHAFGNEPESSSIVYKLEFGDGSLRWQIFQHLNTRLALDSRAFIVTHKGSLQRDYYIAVLGQPKLDHTSANSFNQCGNERGLVIYKYLGDKFVCYKSLPAPEATKLDTISYGVGDSYVVIALMMSDNQVKLYLFDGLQLTNIPTPFERSNLLQYPNQLNHERHRRTMDSPNFHLFMAPPANKNGSASDNGGSNKRTLDGDEMANLALPALAISSSSLIQNGNPAVAATGKQESVFHIPMGDLIRDVERVQTEQQQQQPGADEPNVVKRAFVGQDLLSWCKAKIDSILHDNFDNSRHQLLSLPRVNQHWPIEVNGDLIIDGDLSVSNILYTNRVAEGPIGNITRNEIIHNVPIDFSQTFNQIQQVHLDIDSLKRRVDRYLVDDGSIQDVFVPLTFDTLVVECTRPDINARFLATSNMACPHVDEISTRYLNNIDIHNINQQALLTGRPWRIDKNVRFEHLILRGTADIYGTLNGLFVSDIVFKNGPPGGQITGHKDFRGGLFAGNNLQVGFWNNMPIDRNIYLTSSGYQRIESSIRLGRVVIEGDRLIGNTSRIQRLNNIHLDEYLSQISVKDGENKFELQLDIDELIINGPASFTPLSRLSGVDIQDQWPNTMFKHVNQNVSAPMNFVGGVYISYGGDIVVDGLINGLELNPQVVVMINRDHVIRNPVIFNHSVVIKDVSLEKGLNGIQVAINRASRRNELSILYDGGEQEISGDKILTDVSLGGFSEIYGNINGNLNLTQLYQLANNYNEQQHFSTIRFTGNNLQMANGVPIHIDLTIDGYQIGEICSLALEVAKSQQIQHDRFRFDQPIRFNSLRCSAINGFNNLTRSFLTRYGDQRISSVIKLTNGVIFNTSTSILSTLNGLNVGPLQAAIALEVNQNLTGHREHYGDLHIDDLVVDRINDLQVSSVFVARADVPQIVRARMTFEHLDIENVLVVGTNLATNSFNGLNVSDIMTNTLQYDTPQVVYNPIELNSLHLLPNARLDTKSVNNYDLQRLYGDAVLVDLDQVIVGSKIFTAPVDINARVYSQFGLDSLTNEELRMNLLVHGDEIIEEDIAFMNDVTIKKELIIQSGLIKEFVVRSGLVNEIDVGLFVKSMLDRTATSGHSKVFGNGSVWFKDVKANNIVVGGTVQGIDISRDAITKSDNKNGTYNHLIKQQPPPTLASNLPLIPVPQTMVRPPITTFTTYAQRPLIAPYVTPRPLIVNNNSSVTMPTWVPVWQIPSGQVAGVQVAGVQVASGQVASGQVAGGQVAARPNLVTNTIRPAQQLAVGVAGQQRLNYLAVQNQTNVIDHQYLEHLTRLQTEAIKDLSSRINKYLSVAYYYEIAMKHPGLGPALHIGPADSDMTFMYMKATNKPGEPCLVRGQTVAIMAQQRQPSAPMFTQSSLLRETSNPTIVDSILVGTNQYLFILDTYPEGQHDMVSQVIIYIWDHRSGMYEIQERINLDGFATAMRAFKVNNLACFALASPRVSYGNHSGFPIIYCQQEPLGDFEPRRMLIQMQNVFDLDIATSPTSSQIILAGLCHSRNTDTRMGDLNVIAFDIISQSTITIASRPMVSPLKLHLFRTPGKPLLIELAVSEAITSSEGSYAITRIFALETRPGYLPGRWHPQTSLFYETQIIKDIQFHDIKSVLLDNSHSLLFFQSTNSISVYAPLVTDPQCASQYSLVHRLPTRGANRFLVFNERRNNATSGLHHKQLPLNQQQHQPGPFGHILVLSKDDCEQLQYATLVLKAAFK